MRAFASLRSIAASSSRASSGAARSGDHEIEILRLREQLEGVEQPIHALVAPDRPEAQDDAGLLRNVEAAAAGRAGVDRMLRDEAPRSCPCGVSSSFSAGTPNSATRRSRAWRGQHVDAIGEAIPAREEGPVPAGGLVRHGVVRGDDEIAQPRDAAGSRAAPRSAVTRNDCTWIGVATMAPELEAEPQHAPQLLRELARPAVRASEGAGAASAGARSRPARGAYRRPSRRSGAHAARARARASTP